MKKPDLQSEMDFGEVDPGQFTPALEIPEAPLVQEHLGLNPAEDGTFTDLLKPSSNGNGHSLGEVAAEATKQWLAELAEEGEGDEDDDLPTDPEYEFGILQRGDFEDGDDFDEDGWHDNLGSLPEGLEEPYEPSEENLAWWRKESRKEIIPVIPTPVFTDLDLARIFRTRVVYNHDFGTRPEDKRIDKRLVTKGDGYFLVRTMDWVLEVGDGFPATDDEESTEAEGERPARKKFRFDDLNVECVSRIKTAQVAFAILRDRGVLPEGFFDDPKFRRKPFKDFPEKGVDPFQEWIDDFKNLGIFRRAPKNIKNLTNANVNHYLRGMTFYSDYSGDIGDVLGRAVVRGVEAYQIMVEHHMPFVRWLKYHYLRIIPESAIFDVEDVISAGNVGLMDVVAKYDFDHNATLATYGKRRIWGEMFESMLFKDGLSEEGKKRLKIVNKALSDAKKSKADLARLEEDMFVDDAILNAALEEAGLSEGDYDQLRRIARTRTTSLEDEGTIARRSGGIEKLPYEPVDTSIWSNPEGLLVDDDFRTRIGLAVDYLDRVDKSGITAEVVRMIFWDKLSLKEVGRRFQKTEGEVKGIRDAALRELRKVMDPDKKEWMIYLDIRPSLLNRTQV